jgi:two-component system sensor histidine kinase GlrK
MRVSSKIISGFSILLLLSSLGVWYQLSRIDQMQAVNEQISQFNVISATTALQLQTQAKLLNEDFTKKYFIALDAIYDQQITGARNEFLRQLDVIEDNARSTRERTEAEKLRRALDDYWEAFNRYKEENRSYDPEALPADLIIAMEHLPAQAEVLVDAAQLAIKEQARNAAEIGFNAKRVSWIAAGSSSLLGLIVAVVIVRSINDRLRRLTQGRRAIAKGQFWHRLPTHGSDEFTELSKDFNVMCERLGELDQMKKDFVSHVSHDLKAPLASMRQIMHLLLEGIPGPLNEQQKSLIQLSYNSAERLAAMVGNLLDMSRMEAGAMEYQMSTQDVIPLIKNAADEFQVQAADKQIRLRFECEQPSVFAKCDRDRVGQVIGNLLENALKFSPPDGEIVARVENKDGEVVISVIDSGPGVSDEHKHKIFQKFHQVKHGMKIAGQGVGLGLAICESIVRAHHGHIWVEDNPAGGSVFSFVLQAAADEEVVKCGQTA